MMRRLPPLNSLRAFEATARHLSFSKAAEELNVTPGAVSQQVKLLEDYLQVTLFKRKNRQIFLSEEAQLCLPLLTEALDNMAAAIHAVQQHSQSQKAITVSASPTFATRWLIPRLNSFRHLHPEINVQIDASNRLVDLVSEDIDVAIRFSDTESKTRLYSEFMFSQAIIPVCSPSLLQAHAPLKNPQDLTKLTLLHAQNDSFHQGGVPIDWEIWFASLGISGIDLNSGLHFAQHDLMVEAVLQGQGVALVGSAVVSDYLQQGKLVQLFEASIPLEFSYHLLYSYAKQNQARVQAFCQWLLAEAEKTRNSEKS